jgi:hypothetical protein
MLAAMLALSASAALAEQGAKYLVIAADGYIQAVQPLADWKTAKGVPAKVVPISEIGTSPSQIQAYIRNAYNTWPVRPEYVLLAGSPQSIPAYGYNNDCYYGDMGGDQKMEISVGRFPAENLRECSTMVAKTLAYERPPASGDTTWFVKGTTTVNEDNPPDAYYQADSRLVRGWWQGAGYVQCESLSDFQGHSSSDVNAAARDGRAFITHRGQCVGYWWPPFDQVTPATWRNGAKLPITVSGSCETVTLEPGASMYGDQFVRAGSPDSLGGAVAYFGTTMAGSHVSDKRSACFRGFFRALYPEKEYRLGPATIRGRFQVDSLFPGQWMYYWEWNLMGDPELNVWTARPLRLEVAYDSIIQVAPQTFVVDVTVDGSGFAGALVCVATDSAVYVTGLTDYAGRVELAINPTHLGTMNVVVTGRNLLPFEGTCRVMVGNAPYLVVAGMDVEDYTGNHDSIVNPGEALRLTVRLRNVGAVVADSVAAILRCEDTAVTLIDSTSSYGTILPESTVAGEQFDAAVDSSCREGYVIAASLLVSDAAGDTWTCALRLTVRSGRLEPVRAVFLDSAPGGNGNGRIGRGESGRIQLDIRNSGGGSLVAVKAWVGCPDTNVVLTDSTAWYGEAGAGETLAGDIDRFGITVSPNLPRNLPVRFAVRLKGDGGSYKGTDTFSFEIQAEQGSTSEPTGPDAYGYWCYDNTDTASGRAPGFDWYELAPPGPGQVIPVVSDSNDATVTLRMPFRFKYYGIVSSDSSLSVCSNGFMALGQTSYCSGSNRPMPDTAGPPLMLAPFWDDLNPDETRNGNGTAYQYYDAFNHIWLVEFSEYAHYGQPGIRETFQALFYDPAVYQTPTGDGEIVFMYKRVSLNSGCTVGIEDATETRAIQYLYNNVHAPTAATLAPGRAIKFTTNPPLGMNRPWLILSGVNASDSLYGNGNGRLEPGESLAVRVTVRNSGIVMAENVQALLRPLDDEGLVFDSTAALGPIPAGGQASNTGHPFIFVVSESPSDSVADLALVLTADGYATICYFSLWLSPPAGIASEKEFVPRHTALERIRPSLAARSALVRYSLARPALVDLSLYDAAGRKVAAMAHGRFEPGWYSAKLDAARLSPGVYFLRLAVFAGSREQRFTQKFQVVR